MREVILCALARRVTPATAGDLTDDAIALMQAEGWPRQAWAGVTVKSVSRLLQGAARRGEVRESGRRNEGGVPRPTYESPSPNAHAPMPPPPDPESTGHTLSDKTKRQQFVVFDAMERFLESLMRQQQEIVEMQMAQRRAADELLACHIRELSMLSERMRRDLLAAGLDMETMP